MTSQILRELEPAALRVRCSRSDLARARLPAVRAELADCHLCAHHCGVNRLNGESGICKAGSSARVFSAQVEVSDELELIPVFAIAFSGCDLRCDFCITGAESWNPSAGDHCSMEAIAERAATAMNNGARSIMVLGGEPTIHLPTVVELVAALPDSAVLVWKTNAHGSKRARTFLDGLFDIWLADYKFGNDGCARRLAKVQNYTRVARENLRWAYSHGDLMVRHLLMPGHVECCWAPVAGWLAGTMPDVKVNLRSGFWPAWHAHRHREFTGTAPSDEEVRAHAIASDYGLRLIQ